MKLIDSFCLLFLLSCNNQIDIPYKKIKSKSSGEIKLALLEDRYDNEGIQQCNNFYSFGANEDSTLLY